MRYPEARRRDQIEGRFLDAGSALLQHWPALERQIFGSHPQRVPLRWQLAPMLPQDVDGVWEHFQRAEGAGRTPAKYPKVGVFRFSRAPFDEYVNKGTGQHAVAYVHGTSAVMVGTADIHPLFGVDSAGNYTAAMKIGSGMLQTMVGIWTPDRRLVQPPSATIDREGPIDLTDLPADVGLY